MRNNHIQPQQPGTSSSCWSHPAVGMASHSSTSTCHKSANIAMLVTLVQADPPSVQWGWCQDCWQAIPSSSLPNSGGRPWETLLCVWPGRLCLYHALIHLKNVWYWQIHYNLLISFYFSPLCVFVHVCVPVHVCVFVHVCARACVCVWDVCGQKEPSVGHGVVHSVTRAQW